MIALPSYIDPMIWSAFVEQRKAMKVPFTAQAQKLVVMKLMKFHADGYDANAALEKAAIYGYRSVFVDDTMKVKKEAKDPALAKLDEDKKKAAPMPASVREQLAMVTGRLTEKTRTAA